MGHREGGHGRLMRDGHARGSRIQRSAANCCCLTGCCCLAQTLRIILAGLPRGARPLSVIMRLRLPLAHNISFHRMFCAAQPLLLAVAADAVASIISSPPPLCQATGSQAWRRSGGAQSSQPGAGMRSTAWCCHYADRTPRRRGGGAPVVATPPALLHQRGGDDNERSAAGDPVLLPQREGRER